MLVFYDDILVYSPNEIQHLQHLELVLEVQYTHQLYANLGKCELGKTRVAYLRHFISAEGVAVDEEKVQDIDQWPTPTTLKELRGFLGLSGYYRKFVAGYAKLAVPLTDQLKKDCFGWSEEAEETFQTLKSALQQAPVLAMPNFQRPFVVEADALGAGLGAVLTQDGHPSRFIARCWEHETDQNLFMRRS